MLARETQWTICEHKIFWLPQYGNCCCCLENLEFSFVEFALLQNLPLVWNGPVTGNVMLKIVSLGEGTMLQHISFSNLWCCPFVHDGPWGFNVSICLELSRCKRSFSFRRSSYIYFVGCISQFTFISLRKFCCCFECFSSMEPCCILL